MLKSKSRRTARTPASFLSTRLASMLAPILAPSLALMLAPAAPLLLTATPLAAAEEMAGDPAKGEKVFRKCRACHEVGEGAKAKTGPVLNGVVGRTAGTWEDFNYSDAMVEAGENGLVWDQETLAAYLEKPKDYVEGTKMTFAGLRKESERTDVIAYLATFE